MHSSVGPQSTYIVLLLNSNTSIDFPMAICWEPQCDRRRSPVAGRSTHTTTTADLELDAFLFWPLWHRSLGTVQRLRTNTRSVLFSTLFSFPPFLFVSLLQLERLASLTLPLPQQAVWPS